MFFLPVGTAGLFRLGLSANVPCGPRLPGVVRNRVTREAGLVLPGWVMAPSGFQRRCECGPRCWRGGQAARGDREDLATQALAVSEPVSGPAARHGVSRALVDQQAHKARAAFDDAFSSAAASDDEVLFELAVTKAWLRQAIVGLALVGRSSYRGVVEFVRDLPGMAISAGCAHDVLQAATRQASAINRWGESLL